MTLPLAFYGDDFTGSTDALEWLSRAGLRTVLFLDPPDAESLAPFGELAAVGVAGLTRSLPPTDMRPVLDRAFVALRALHPRFVHYKVCSTFDSAPGIGSIGCALEAGLEAYGNPLVPLLVAAPPLGRHCVFGNLFARMGIGSDGAIHRLDRHPAMSRHPVTPADESDLRLHLARQTAVPCDLVDLLQLRHPTDAPPLPDPADGAPRALLIDALEDGDLPAAGDLLARIAAPGRPQFVIGSSGVEMALAPLLGGHGTPPASTAGPAAGPVLVLSGSCSPVTAAQIDHALTSGFTEVALDPPALLEAATRPGEVARVAERCAASLERGRPVVVHSSRGPDDPRQQLVLEQLARDGLRGAAAAAHTGETFGRALGEIAARVSATEPPARLMIAGGDSSSHAAHALGIHALQFDSLFTPGAPLCRIHAPGRPVHGAGIVFKGGQVGTPDLFSRLLAGAPDSETSRTS